MISESFSLETYGSFTTDPSPEQLQTFFTLNPIDLEQVATCRTPHSKLGYALQLCTLRFLGTFLTDPSQVPNVVLEFVKHQLSYDFIDLEPYLEAQRLHFRHQRQIRDYLGYKEFRGAAVIAVIRVLFERLNVAEENN